MGALPSARYQAAKFTIAAKKTHPAQPKGTGAPKKVSEIRNPVLGCPKYAGEKQH